MVCARCLGRTRSDLRRIADLCRLLPTAATERGVGSASMVLAGPVPEHSTHTARHRWAMAGGLCRCDSREQTCPDTVTLLGPACVATVCGHPTCERIHGRRTCPDLVDWLEYADDERHPLWCLGTWEILVAEHLEHDRRARVTIQGAAAYLDLQLTYLASDASFAFDELAREVRVSLGYVEEVLEVAPHTQRGAPCPVCRSQGRKPQPLERHYADDHGVEHPDDSRDWWVCPDRSCAQTWTVAEYERYVAGTYVAEADRLTAAQIAARYRVPEGSVRGWASAGKVAKHGRDERGRVLYDVAQTLRMRDRARQPTA